MIVVYTMVGIGEVPKLASSPKKFWRSYGDVKRIMNYYYFNPGETTAAAYCQEIKIRPEKSDLKNDPVVNKHDTTLLCDSTWPHVSKATKAKLAELGYLI